MTAVDEERPLFDSPEQVVQCAFRGLPDGCKAIPLEREGGSGSAQDRADRLFRRSERYAVAWAVLRRATECGLNEMHVAVLVGLLVEEKSWHEVAELGGLDDDQLTASGVRSRVYRAFHAGLRLIREAM